MPLLPEGLCQEEFLRKLPVNLSHQDLGDNKYKRETRLQSYKKWQNCWQPQNTSVLEILNQVVEKRQKFTICKYNVLNHIPTRQTPVSTMY